MEVITRTEFKNRDAMSQSSFIRSGGRVIDDEPVFDPFEGAKAITDGRERWEYIKKVRAWNEETARLKAEQRV